MEDMKKYEISDDELDVVAGGYKIGTTVHCQNHMITYCSNCAKLLMRYDATITGIRGVLDGKTIYWITRHCCGYKTSVLESDIID